MKRIIAATLAIILTAGLMPFTVKAESLITKKFDFVGHGFNTTAASGDKIIICSAVAIEDGFGDYTYSVHSANVTSSSGATRSKLGSYGVYIIPIDELVHFYSGFYYNIYR